MPARRKINQNLKPQESKANEFIQSFKFDKFMDYDKEAEDMALLIIEVILRQGFVAIPVLPKQDDDDEIPFASKNYVPRSVWRRSIKGTRIPPRYSIQLNKQLMRMEIIFNFKIIFFSLYKGKISREENSRLMSNRNNCNIKNKRTVDPVFQKPLEFVERLTNIINSGHSVLTGPVANFTTQMRWT